MADIEVKLDEKRLAEVQRMLAGIPRAMPKVMSRGVNKTVTKARTDLTNRLAGKVALKKKFIRENIFMRKASYKRWQATLTLGWWPINLKHFSARQTKKGVTYKIDKTGKRQLLTHAFILEQFGGNVFRRVTKGGGLVDRIKAAFGKDAPEQLVGRLPIEVRKGPSLKEVYNGDRALPSRTLKEAMANLNKNIDTQIKLILDKRAAAS